MFVRLSVSWRATGGLVPLDGPEEHGAKLDAFKHTTVLLQPQKDRGIDPRPVATRASLLQEAAQQLRCAPPLVPRAAWRPGASPARAATGARRAAGPAQPQCAHRAGSVRASRVRGFLPKDASHHGGRSGGGWT